MSLTWTYCYVGDLYHPPERPDRSACPDARASSVMHACGNAAPAAPSSYPLLSLRESRRHTSFSCPPPSPRAPSPEPLLSLHGQDPGATMRMTRRARPVRTTLGVPHTSTTGPRAPHPPTPACHTPSPGVRAVPHDSLPLKYETLGCIIRLKQMKHLKHTLGTCV